MTFWKRLLFHHYPPPSLLSVSLSAPNPKCAHHSYTRCEKFLRALLAHWRWGFRGFGSDDARLYVPRLGGGKSWQCSVWWCRKSCLQVGIILHLFHPIGGDWWVVVVVVFALVPTHCTDDLVYSSIIYYRGSLVTNPAAIHSTQSAMRRRVYTDHPHSIHPPCLLLAVPKDEDELHYPSIQCWNDDSTAFVWPQVKCHWNVITIDIGWGAEGGLRVSEWVTESPEQRPL